MTDTLTRSTPEITAIHLSSFGHRLDRFSKRAFDLFVAFWGLVFLSPLFLLIALLLKRESPGPVFYRGPRAGCMGRQFAILKFRTMYEQPASYAGPRITAEDDERVTPLGRWLRDTKLNELPQLWNVLVGEMSLVGPRPEDFEIAKRWPSDAREEILSIRPGITSPASVLYRGEESLLSAEDVMTTYMQSILPDKLRLDRLYVRNRSFLGDLDTLFWTAVALLPRLDRVRIPEGALFAGPFYRIVRRYISWFLIDLIVSLVAVTSAGVLWRAFEPIHWGVNHLALLALALALLFSTMNALLGMRQIMWSRASAEDGMVLAITNGVTVLLLLLLNKVQVYRPWLPLPGLPPELITLIGMLAFLGFIVMRYRLRVVTSIASRWLTWRRGSSGFGERVLILGAGEGGQIASWLLRRDSLKQTLNVIGMVDDDPAKQGMRVDGCRILGSSGDLPDLIRKHDVGLIVFAISKLHDAARETLLHSCHKSNVRVVFLSDILGSVQSHLLPAHP